MTQRNPSPLFTLAALETYRHPCDTPGCDRPAASADNLLCVDCAEGERLRWHCGDDEGDTLDGAEPTFGAIGARLSERAVGYRRGAR